MATKQMNIRVDAATGRAAAKALGSMGLTTADAVRILLKRIAVDNAFPLELKVPNAKTKAAMREARSQNGRKRYANVKTLMVALDEED